MGHFSLTPIDMIDPYKKIYNLNEARAKIEAYCAYQERSHKQVNEKLYSYGLRKEVRDELISELIQSNFLNENRFALAFTSGKFRIKKWGKHKIKMYLQQHHVSEYNIKKAIESIDNEEYLSTFFHLADKRWDDVKNEGSSKRRQKTMSFLYNKGWEKELIYEFINDQK